MGPFQTCRHFAHLSSPQSIALLIRHYSSVPRVRPTYGFTRRQIINAAAETKHDSIAAIGVLAHWLVLGNVTTTIVRHFGVTDASPKKHA
jgi:hypothetical protein